MPAILFGSIGSICDVSELERLSFNEAFCQLGLNWSWSHNYYADLLQRSGERQRIQSHSESLGQTVDVESIYQLKNRIFCQAIAASELRPRAGVIETIHAAQHYGYSLALVTTTEQDILQAVLLALEPQVSAMDFDCIVTRDDVIHPKPSPDAYRLALKQLGVSVEAAIAIEDHLDGLASARRAELSCVAFPGVQTSAHCFVGAVLRRQQLDFSTLAEQLQTQPRRAVMTRPPAALSAA